MNQNKFLINDNNNYNDGNSYISYERKERNNKSEIEQINPPNNIGKFYLKNDNENINKYSKEKDSIVNITDNYNKTEFNFCKFLAYIVRCNKNNQSMNYVEKLRHKIISEETIVQSYLNLKEMNKLSKFVK